MISPLFQSTSDFHPVVIENKYDNNNFITLYQGDSRTFLKTIPDGSISLVVTSPPYNIGKSYESKQVIATYLSEQEPIIRELVRTLSNQGSICWQTGNYIDEGEVFPLDVFYYHIFKKHGLKLRNRITWHFEHGLHASKRFSGRYETILWFAKSDDYTFNLDPVRIPAKYPGNRHFKGPNKGQPSGNPLGKNPSDILELLYQEWETCVWDIPNVKANHVEKTIHPCQFPIELVERFIVALTAPGDLVVDPYLGVGSTACAAVKHGRRAAGADIVPEYVRIARERVALAAGGTLATRPMHRPVHRPDPASPLARREPTPPPPVRPP